MELHFPLILDGATGTQLQKRGYANGQCAEEWVLAHPEVLQEIQRSYIEAGSHVVYASTFGANRVKLEENGIFNQVEDYNKRLVAISKAVAGDRAYVAGDLAPTGKFLAPMGDLSFEELVDIYAEQAKALEEAGVDLFVIETMMTVPEARAAVLAVKQVSKKPVFVSFTCDENGKTLMGADVTAVLLIMQGLGVDAFGLNCSVGPEDMLVQLHRLAQYAEVPLIAKPNAGMPQIVAGKTVYNCPPEEFAELVPEFGDAGVAIFGGCCGTEAEHIRALSTTAQTAEIRRPAPLHPELLPLATEKVPALLPANVQVGTILNADDTLSEAVEDQLEEADPLVAISIQDEEGLEYFADIQYALTKPLCLCCNDGALLERALRLYQGRAMYQGSLEVATLKKLNKKYGVIF